LATSFWLLATCKKQLILNDYINKNNWPGARGQQLIAKKNNLG